MKRKTYIQNEKKTFFPLEKKGGGRNSSCSGKRETGPAWQMTTMKGEGLRGTKLWLDFPQKTVHEIAQGKQGRELEEFKREEHTAREGELFFTDPEKLNKKMKVTVGAERVRRIKRQKDRKDGILINSWRKIYFKDNLETSRRNGQGGVGRYHNR